jgi:hypothetical protein
VHYLFFKDKKLKGHDSWQMRNLAEADRIGINKLENELKAQRINETPLTTSPQ